MLRQCFIAIAALVVITLPAEARRIALVIGQNGYNAGLSTLANPGNDARRIAALLGEHGFDVLSCDGKQPGCFDLTRAGMLAALGKLEGGAKGADMALVYFAGHGLATDEGNILTPVDAKVDCATGTIAQGVLVERILKATEPARHKLVILDACRDNPLGAVCPGLKGKKLSFSRIEAGAMQGLLLVTSTQFGQTALDGLAGAHSPFATSLFAALEANPGIYFEQVFNEVARATHAAAQAQAGFLQIPGKVVGGAAPADCLAGKGCVGDPRMAALAVENERLAGDAAGVRNLLAAEEKARGKAYTPEERQAAVDRIGRSLTSLAGSSEPKVKEASRLFGEGRVTEGRAKLDEALDDDEKAALEIERLAVEKRKVLARNARDAAGLARGTDILKALGYYQRATRNDPSDAQTWDDYARAAVDAGKLPEAKTAFEQAALKARDSNNPRLRYWATLGLGDVALAQGSLPSARRLFEAAAAIIEPLAKAAGDGVGVRPLTSGPEKDPSRNRQGSDPILLGAKADPGNAGWQRDLALSFGRVARVEARQGDRVRALGAFRQGRDIIARLKAASPTNATLPRDLAWFEAEIVTLEKPGN